jgi:hypothetical protein
MPPHQLPHRGIAFDTAQQIIFFSRQHGGIPPGAQRAGGGSITLAI